jgi:hypothetical protein
MMASYRLTEDAKADLIRIYQRGLREFGEGQADEYYEAFLNREYYSPLRVKRISLLFAGSVKLTPSSPIV